MHQNSCCVNDIVCLMYKNLLLLQKMFMQFVKNAQKKCADN